MKICIMKNTYKTILLVTLVVGYIYNVKAQQRPVINLYNMNRYAISSAYAGYTDYSTVNVLHRRQWTQFGVPTVASYISGDMRLGKTSGVGLMISNDKAHILSRTTAYASYSKKFMLGKKKRSYVALGLSAGMRHNGINTSGALIQDANDFVVSNYQKNGFYSGLGLLLKINRFQIAWGNPAIREATAGNSSILTNKARMGYMEYEFQVAEKVVFRPNLFAYTSSSAQYGDLTLEFEFNKFLTVGLGGRNNKTGLVKLGLIPTNNIQVAYSYESSESLTQRLGSHEIMFSFLFNRKKTDMVGESEENNYTVLFKNDKGEEHKYHFSKLERMQEFLVNLDTADTEMYVRLKDQSDFEVLILGKGEEPKTYRFGNLEKMDDFFSGLYPDQKAQLKDTLRVNDDYVLDLVMADGTTRKYSFKTLQELDDFMLDLERRDPVLAAKLKASGAFDAELLNDGAKRKFKFTSLQNMNEVWLKEQESRPLLDGELKSEDDYILIVNNPDGTKKNFHFKTLDGMSNYLLNMDQTNPELAGQMKNGVDIDVLIPGREKKNFKYQTLATMNQVLLDQDPILSMLKEDEKELSDDMKILREEQRYQYKKLTKNKEILLSMNEDDPLLAERIKAVLDNNPELIVVKTAEGYQVQTADGHEGKKYNFTTLEGMTNFVLEMDEGVILSESQMAMEDSLSLIIETQFVHSSDSLKTLEVVKEVEVDKMRMLTESEKQALAKTIKFDLNSFEISAKSDLTIASIVKVLQDHPGFKIQIIGRTCDLGDENHNLTIAQKRAKAVRDRLLTDEVDAKQMTILVLGESFPIVPNTSEENREVNRVAQFKLIVDEK